MQNRRRTVQLEDYEPFIGPDAILRIRQKAKKAEHLHVTHINSTYYGGGVATLLGSLSILMNNTGIKTGWRVIQGSRDFFNTTKKFHNALQGGVVELSDQEKVDYEDTIYENAVRNHLSSHDRVIIHDPQPLPMIRHYPERGPFIWRCHIDLTNPFAPVWDYLRQFINQYDAVIFSLEEYAQAIEPPQVYFMPAIDPFTVTNRPMEEAEIMAKLAEYDIPADLPIVTQVSRFDPWKDPQGVIRAFRLASEEVGATLVLLGSMATDDPEGVEVYRSLVDQAGERIKIIAADDSALVNALQRQSVAVLQKSLREGFGLTVSEAMWKGTPVIGGDVGGIRHQLKHGENGFLVSSEEEAANCIVELVKNKDLRSQMGESARKTVQENFLMTRLLEQYIDLLNAFQVVYRFQGLEG